MKPTRTLSQIVTLLVIGIGILHFTNLLTLSTLLSKLELLILSKWGAYAFIIVFFGVIAVICLGASIAVLEWGNRRLVSARRYHIRLKTCSESGAKLVSAIIVGLLLLLIYSIISSPEAVSPAALGYANADGSSDWIEFTVALAFLGFLLWYGWLLLAAAWDVFRIAVKKIRAVVR